MNNPVTPVRGEIWYVDWSPARGSEQAGRRPSLIVQADAPNRNPRYPNTIVATISEHGRDIPSHVRLEPTPENGLAYASYVKCEQILTISKSRLQERIGGVEEADLRRVEQALKRMLALP